MTHELWGHNVWVLIYIFMLSKFSFCFQITQSFLKLKENLKPTKQPSKSDSILIHLWLNQAKVNLIWSPFHFSAFSLSSALKCYQCVTADSQACNDSYLLDCPTDQAYDECSINFKKSGKQIWTVRLWTWRGWLLEKVEQKWKFWIQILDSNEH